MNDATKKKLYIAGFIFNILLLIFWLTFVFICYIGIYVVSGMFDTQTPVPLGVDLGFWLSLFIIIMTLRPLWKLIREKILNIFDKIFLVLYIIPLCVFLYVLKVFVH